MKNIWAFTWVLSLTVILVSCMATEPNHNVSFLRWHVPSGDVELALTEGNLVLEGTCLRLQPRSGGAGYALIWPFEFDVETDGNTVTILGGEGQSLAQVGDYLQVGGGAYGDMSAEEFERFVIGSAQCEGPYWRVDGVSAAPAPDEIHFLRERQHDGPSMGALLEGDLILSAGCLRVRYGDADGDSYTGDSYAAIWPFEYGVGVEGEHVRILGREGQTVAQVGERVWVGGGEVGLSAEELEELVVTGPVKCAGPYWLVASVEEVPTF